MGRKGEPGPEAHQGQVFPSRENEEKARRLSWRSDRHDGQFH